MTIEGRWRSGKDLRTILGYVLAPFPAALIQASVVALWPKIDKGGVFAHPTSMFVAICLLFYALQTTLGVACIFFIRRRMLATLKNYVFAGLIAIALPISFVVLWAATRSQLAASAIIYNLIYFTLGGALAGVVFWIIAERTGRPSK